MTKRVGWLPGVERLAELLRSGFEVCSKALQACCQEAAYLHLADPESGGDVGLRQTVYEAELENELIALRELVESKKKDRLVFDMRQRFVVATKRLHERLSILI